MKKKSQYDPQNGPITAHLRTDRNNNVKKKSQ